MSHKQIYYSDKYNDEHYEYRHVVLPREMVKQVPKSHLMSEDEWRRMGVQQSLGWVHYMIHEPEPHILLFRRPLPKNWSGTFLPVNIPWYSLNTCSPTSYIVCCAWSCLCLSNQAHSDCMEEVNVLSPWHLMDIVRHHYVATSTTLIPKCLRWISTFWSSVEIKYWVTCYWHNMLFFYHFNIIVVWPSQMAACAHFSMTNDMYCVFYFLTEWIYK